MVWWREYPWNALNNKPSVVADADTHLPRIERVIHSILSARVILHLRAALARSVNGSLSSSQLDIAVTRSMPVFARHMSTSCSDTEVASQHDSQA